MRVTGVDLGGHTVSAALVDDGVLLERIGERTAGRTPDKVLPQIARIVAALSKGAPTPVGLGVPAMLDGARERIVLMPNFSGWDGLPLRRLLEDELGAPVALENDGNCYALGEGGAGGAAEGLRDYLLFTLGTGIGGGAVVDGRLLSGFHGMGWEPGHMAAGEEGRCGCGVIGHLEALCGADAIERAALSLGLPPDVRALWARRADRSVAALWERALEPLARAIASAVQLLDPRAVVLGGGMSRGDSFVDEIRPRVAARLAPPFQDLLDLRPALLGDDAPLLGAARIAGTRTAP
jgi:glucokinase